MGLGRTQEEEDYCVPSLGEGVADDPLPEMEVLREDVSSVVHRLKTSRRL